MGYQTDNQQYIIENDVEESNEARFQKEMRNAADINNGLPDGYEVEQTISPNQNVQQEIQEAAEQEGLVSDTEYLGGEGASPQEVIKAMKEEGMSKGALKNKEEFEEQQMDNLKVVTATRDLLMNRVKALVPIYVPMVVDDIDPKTGKPCKTAVKVEFKARRLTEAENTHILNHKLIGKEIKDMTDEEYRESSHFRSNLLSKAIEVPKMSPEEWRNECDNGTLGIVYDELNKVLTEADDVSKFQ